MGMAESKKNIDFFILCNYVYIFDVKYFKIWSYFKKNDLE